MMLGKLLGLATAVAQVRGKQQQQEDNNNNNSSKDDPYSILNIPEETLPLLLRKADGDELQMLQMLREKYLKESRQALESHNRQLFIRLSNAYKVISDKSRREAYNRHPSAFIPDMLSFNDSMALFDDEQYLDNAEKMQRSSKHRDFNKISPYYRNANGSANFGLNLFERFFDIGPFSLNTRSVKPTHSIVSSQNDFRDFPPDIREKLAKNQNLTESFKTSNGDAVKLEVKVTERGDHFEKKIVIHRKRGMMSSSRVIHTYEKRD